MRLLVIIPDHLSALIQKGEITSRYYNPGNLFDEVHILMTNPDRPEKHDVQKTVGTAQLFFHNLPEDQQYFLQSRSWFKSWLRKPWARPILWLVQQYQIRLLDQWAAPAVELARQIQPDLIRCHGHQANLYVARRIKQALGVPYVVSLHGNPDLDYFRGRLGVTEELRLLGDLFLPIELIGLRNAGHVVAVYSAILPFFARHKLSNASLIYNVVGVGGSKKNSYVLDKSRVRCLCVNRQARLEKDPTPIIDAVIEMPNVQLLLVGDGDLHEDLVAHVNRHNAGDRIQFIRALPNSDVLQTMHESDIFVYASVIGGLSKGCIEAALTGLPVILKGGDDQLSSEFAGDHFLLVDGSKDSFKSAITRLVEDDTFREQLGRRAYAYACEHWAPENIESRYVDLYNQLLAK